MARHVAILHGTEDGNVARANNKDATSRGPVLIDFIIITGYGGP